ncbi:hypothetical protein ASPNIDRAFT_36409 [Aspergillus niger ATCC 1015]|uniref:Nephrocystin 3-like N-terminal domain-containing protein n=2 Tax=Aspergillus niger TaxID=5061 RepID=G3XQR6_ASPNA|nr:hypothetical protein ASPNIDRAFT_36409 [Aspergillus niger ATCC 1015]KAI2994200.1 hypothetical protein CBS147345_10035 [Aspergillus niger]TPR11973.1 Dihydrodipicolinate synthetase family protein [Aspergillus niger]SPB44553.1 unnamed protein product [Aspergillus niger]
MDRWRARLSRRLKRFQHEEPAADTQSTSPDCRRRDPVEHVKELSMRGSTASVSSEDSIRNRNQHEEAMPQSLPEKRRSLSNSDSPCHINSVTGENRNPDSGFPEPSKPGSDEEKAGNLWKEAFERLSPTSQDRLRVLGYEPGSETHQAGAVDILLNDLQEKRMLCEKKAWKYKNEIFVRDYAAKCATWVKLIGDLVVPFAPSQAAGPWGLIKVALEIPVKFADEMVALLGTVERVLQATYRGREYESAYATGNNDIADTLRRNLVNVYQAILELLSYSINMLSKSTWTRILDTMLDKGSGLFSELTAKEEELAKTAQACSAATGGKTLYHLQDVRRHLPRIETQVAESLEKLEWGEAMEILDWISPVKYGSHHNNVRGNRTPGTGEWLLQNGTFRDWEESSSSAVLWLRGSPGVGKTFLTSRVIDHVQDTLTRVPNDEGFAYFYCNRTEDNRTRPLAVAQSYVRQLSASASKSSSLYIQSRLRSTYRELRMCGEDLDFKRCRTLLTESLNLYPRTTLVLDAFDECDLTSRGDLLQLFQDLLSSSTRPVKLFIASRPDGDVQQQVRSYPNIDIQATDNHQDIQAYISQEMLKLIEKNRAFGKLRDEIESTLSERSQGMFQWTYLQLKQLGKCMSPEAIRECLGALPKTLDETYDRLYEEIEENPPHDRDLALRALKWVLAAREPLSRELLLEAVRINPDVMTTELCTPITDDALLALCRNFLVIDSERDVWRVSHLSVAEYFELRRSWTTAVTNFMVGKACLLFMLSDTCWNESIHAPNDDEELYALPLEYDFSRPFLYYVARYWPGHIANLRYIGVSDDDLSTVTKLLEKFLGAPQDSSAQYRVWARYYSELQPVEHSLLVMCIYGPYLEVSDRWWNEVELDLANTNDSGDTSMLLAARYGHIPTLRILLAKGGNLGIQGSSTMSTPLIEAADRRRVETARFLLNQKADVNLKIDRMSAYRTCALEAAIMEEDSDMVQLLVSEGHADVNMHLDNYYGSPLAVASFRNWLEGTKFLVEQGGADVNLALQYGNYGSALAAAAGSCGAYLETVKYLVEVRKADVNLPLPKSRYGSVLAMVAWRMKIALRNSHCRRAANLREIVRILLAAGALVVLSVGKRKIVDALEASYERGCDNTRDDGNIGEDSDSDDQGPGCLYEEDADHEGVEEAEESAKAMRVYLQRAMWQQYTSGALGRKEAKYVEAKYGQTKAWRVPD